MCDTEADDRFCNKYEPQTMRTNLKRQNHRTYNSTSLPAKAATVLVVTAIEITTTATTTSTISDNRIKVIRMRKCEIEKLAEMNKKSNKFDMATNQTRQNILQVRGCLLKRYTYIDDTRIYVLY